MLNYQVNVKGCMSGSGLIIGEERGQSIEQSLTFIGQNRPNGTKRSQIITSPKPVFTRQIKYNIFYFERKLSNLATLPVKEGLYKSCTFPVKPFSLWLYSAAKTKSHNSHSLITGIVPGITSQLNCLHTEQVSNTFPFQVKRGETQ